MMSQYSGAYESGIKQNDINQSTIQEFHLHAGYTTCEGIHGNIFKGVTLNFPEMKKRNMQFNSKFEKAEHI